MRVPFIARWPGRIPAGDAVIRAGDDHRRAADVGAARRAAVPQDRIIDGKDIWPLLGASAGAASPHDVSISTGARSCTRCERAWKLHLPHPYQSLEAAGADGAPGKYVRKEIELSLFDDADPGETTNLAAVNPKVVEDLMRFVENARADLGDSRVKRTGKNVRPVWRL